MSVHLLDADCEDYHLSHGSVYFKCMPPNGEGTAVQQRAVFTRAARVSLHSTGGLILVVSLSTENPHLGLLHAVGHVLRNM